MIHYLQQDRDGLWAEFLTNLNGETAKFEALKTTALDAIGGLFATYQAKRRPKFLSTLFDQFDQFEKTCKTQKLMPDDQRRLMKKSFNKLYLALCAVEMMRV